MKIPTEIKVSAKLFIEVTEWIWIWLNPNDWPWSDEKATSPNNFLFALFPFFACFSPPWLGVTWSPECCSHAMIALLQPSCSLPLLECNLFHLLLGKPSFEIFLWTSFTKGGEGQLVFIHISISLYKKQKKVEKKGFGGRGRTPSLKLCHTFSFFKWRLSFGFNSVYSL